MLCNLILGYLTLSAHHLQVIWHCEVWTIFCSPAARESPCLVTTLSHRDKNETEICFWLCRRASARVRGLAVQTQETCCSCAACFHFLLFNLWAVRLLGPVPLLSRVESKQSLMLLLHGLCPPFINYCTPSNPSTETGAAQHFQNVWLAKSLNCHCKLETDARWQSRREISARACHFQLRCLRVWCEGKYKGRDRYGLYVN